MKIPFKFVLIDIVLFVVLLGSNIYQYDNPKTVSVPAPVQMPIDHNTWVLRSKYESRGKMIRQLRDLDKTLSERIRKSHNKIAAYTNITGKLRIQIDSLKNAQNGSQIIRHDSVATFPDTTLTFTRTFSDSLFQVTSKVRMHNWHVWNSISMAQLRTIKLNVVTTIAKNDDYVLTYVNSPDFKLLHYKSKTNLKAHRHLPWFWIGTAAGILVTHFVLK